MDPKDETQYNRRVTDSALSHWLAVALAAVVAIGGTVSFTFGVYESVRAQLVELSALQPTLTAHIAADSELHRIYRSRMDYLERRIDALATATRANTRASEPDAGGDPTRAALEERIKALEARE